ncbi:penicillin-binding protein 1A [Mangrovibacterium marinum]|uniref:Penicillin-binding protein 1A n=1 Tax=Mangrovibacterium marinum TaxID=1639118 RepID=A0A2T5C0N9_9BACT|nr:transglycosylase domain-containing protein [Mangrovibacterium marinum]PTN08083.1 penicillin-binding protein 1A [Mangrovibacterium marinum]
MPPKKTSSARKPAPKSRKKASGGKRKKTTKKKSAGRRILLFFLKAAVIAFILFALFFTSVYLGFWGYVPSTAQLHDIKNPQASEVFSAEGKLLGRYYIENRSNVRYEEISPNVIHALVATEDSRFYEHRGIDEVALMRVFVRTLILQDRSAGGGSTLSQQIAKNLFPRNKLGYLSMPVNKLREAIIAYRLERIYTKEEILALYLNTVPFGENIYGIEVAAERFFNKSPKNLTVDEAAVLVGMLKANNYYNPRLHPERSKERRNVVIGQMVKNEYLSEEQGRVFQQKPLTLRYTRISYNEGPAPYFMEMLKPELKDWCANNKKENGDPYNLYTDGLKIKTTVSYDYQHFAESAVKEYMKNLQTVFDNHWKSSSPWSRKPDILTRAMKQTERYRKMKAAGKSAEEIKNAFNEKHEMVLFNWSGDRQVLATPMDSLKHYLRMLNAGFLGVEPATGEVKAWVGGVDFRYFKYDHVNAARQVGSTFKPFVYLSALENGLEPDDYFSNERKVYHDYQDWSPQNSHPDYQGYYSMQGALAKSINTVAVEVLMQTGIDEVVETARDLGITARLPEYPSLALGVASISLKEMVSAYATILNDGVYMEPHYLVSIEDAQGRVLQKFAKPTPVKTGIDPENCRMIVHMLESVISDGTGSSIRSAYRVGGDFAGKTGTTQDHSDGWFMGMTPRLVTGCWVGSDDPSIHFRTITYGQGAYMALPIVGKFYSKLYSDSRYKRLQYASFRQPKPRLLAKLSVPPYRENLAPGSVGDLIGTIFGKQKQEADDRSSGTGEKKEKKKIWQSIKDIFKKKK